MHVHPVLVAGAGPAGLTAALELSRVGVPVAVHEAEHAVGGIARTETYRGYRFDIGGHRFYTKVAEVERLWLDLLGRELIRVPRLSRIFYRGRYYAYPLQLPNVVRNLGLVESARMTSSYLRARLQPAAPEAPARPVPCHDEARSEPHGQRHEPGTHEHRCLEEHAKVLAPWPR